MIIIVVITILTIVIIITFITVLYRQSLGWVGDWFKPLPAVKTDYHPLMPRSMLRDEWAYFFCISSLEDLYTTPKPLF